MLHITALMDDQLSGNRALTAEHGLSLYAEFNGRRILFDCGSGPHFLQNAHRLGIDLHNLDAVVLSHSHYDHATGFRELAEKGLGSNILYTGPHFFEPKYAKIGVKFANLSAGFDRFFLQNRGIGHREVTDMTEIFPGVFLVCGFPRVFPFEQIPARFVRQTGSGFRADDFADEICMAFAVSGGLAVLVGCSHPGILNMVTHVREVLDRPIRALFGGTHLVEAAESRTEATIQYLQDMGVEVLGLSHCSGEAAQRALAGKPEIQSCHLGVGDCVFFD